MFLPFFPPVSILSNIPSSRDDIPLSIEYIVSPDFEDMYMKCQLDVDVEEHKMCTAKNCFSVQYPMNKGMHAEIT